MRRRTGKPRIEPVVWQPPRAPERSKQTRAGTFDLTVYGLPGAGSEDVALDAEGRVLTGLADGRILRVSPDGRHIETVADTQGRPLGIEVDADGGLVVCDALRGLLRVDPASGAVHQLVERIGATPMLFCNNAVLAADGTVYFTDSSRHFGIEYYQGDLLAHSGTGRLFRRTPHGAVDMVADGLQFANGVALSPGESWLVVAETGGYCLDRIWLTGPRAGEREPLVENLAGFPDNVSTGSDGLIWVALPSRRNPILDRLLPAPPLLRKIAWALPDTLQPKERSTVWVQAYDAAGRLVHDLQTEHETFRMVTGVRERDGVIWLGSLTEPAIGRIDLP
jgi:sugar lactone lactonase YvrE